MPAESLNCPPRSNVSAAKDNNNIHRFPAVVNRSAQHRPHRTKFGRRLSAKPTTSRRKVPSSPPSVRLHAYPTDTAFAHSTQPSQKTKTGLCGLRCAKLFSHILRGNRVPADAAAGRGKRKCAAAAVRRVRDERGGGRAAGAREGREVRVTILKCENFDKTSLQKFSF